MNFVKDNAIAFLVIAFLLGFVVFTTTAVNRADAFIKANAQFDKPIKLTK